VENRKIPGYKNTFADELGNIYKGERRLTPCRWSKTKKYLRVTVFSDSGKQMTVSVHRLVLEAFVGVRPNNMQACHNNGNHLDNSIKNLRWDTCRNNILNKFKHGTMPLGENNNKSKLTSDQVILIRSCKGMATSREMAKYFNVSQPTISNILRGDIWKHV
jgi:hypothetical protein